MDKQDSPGRKSGPVASDAAAEISNVHKHFSWKRAKSNIRILCAAATGLVAALAVQVAEAQQRGTADLVWQHVFGQVHYWPMRAGQRQGGINIFTPIGNDWVLRGVGDVDGVV